MCVIDTDSSIGIKSCFRSAVKCTTYHFHISFLETCKQFNVYPSGLVLKKRPFISFVSKELIASWEETIQTSQSQLLETLLMGINEKLIDFERTFWSDLTDIVKTVENDQLECFLIKLCVHLEKEEKRVYKRKKERNSVS